MEIGSAQLKRLIAHHVGNKIREENFTLSVTELKAPKEVASIFLKNYLGGIINSGNLYEFFHESNVQLNELNVFTEEIFNNESNFFDASTKIAKHLYSKSTHPNISGGDFFISLFDGIEVEGVEKRAIGLFKVETKEKFLSIKNDQGTLVLQEREGIDPRDIQKAALIIEGNTQIFALERGNTKTTYWIDEFLKIKPQLTPKLTASYAGKIVKKIISEIDDFVEVEKYKNQIEALLESTNSTLDKLSSINEKFIGKEKSSSIRDGISLATGLAIPPNVTLDQKLMQKATKSAFRKIKISSGIDLLLSGSSTPKSIKKEFSNDNRIVTIYINFGDEQ